MMMGEDNRNFTPSHLKGPSFHPSPLQSLVPALRGPHKDPHNSAQVGFTGAAGGDKPAYVLLDGTVNAPPTHPLHQQRNGRGQGMAPVLQDTPMPHSVGTSSLGSGSGMFTPVVVESDLNTWAAEFVPGGCSQRSPRSRTGSTRLESPAKQLQPNQGISFGPPSPAQNPCLGLTATCSLEGQHGVQGMNGEAAIPVGAHRPGEPMVQVVRGGCIFFVPESQAILEEAASVPAVGVIPSTVLHNGSQPSVNIPGGVVAEFSGVGSIGLVSPDSAHSLGIISQLGLESHGSRMREVSPVVQIGEGSTDDGCEWGDAGRMPLEVPRQGLELLGLPSVLWAHFNNQRIAQNQVLVPDDPRCNEVPAALYHSCFPLDKYADYYSVPSASVVNSGENMALPLDMNLNGLSPGTLRSSRRRKGASGSFGYPSAVYKVISREDGQCYCIRRFDNVRTTAKIAAAAAKAWARIRHPNLVALHNVFLEHALYFEYEYYPCAETLQEVYIDTPGALLPERLLWSYIVQIVTAVRAVHSCHMACRMVALPHLLLTSGGRLRLNSCGVSDVLEFESRKTVEEFQQDDLVALGTTIVSLACRSQVSSQSLSNSLILLSQNYSPELHSLVMALVTKAETLYEICARMTSYFMDELDTAFAVTNGLETHLRQEYDNSRLFRLLLKLGTINERPQYQLNESWSETGDRYILKLFRDYVFHQVDENGNPYMDFGHVIESLNKLDLGDKEKILLTSRDQRSILIVSFEDVKRILEETFEELCQESPVLGIEESLHQGNYAYNMMPPRSDSVVPSFELIPEGISSLPNGNLHPMGAGATVPLPQHHHLAQGGIYLVSQPYGMI